MANIGEVIDGKYEIVRQIGKGGMSIVYLAMDKRLSKQWAVKEYRKDKNDESNKAALQSLLKEADIMKKLDHPTLPRIVDVIDTSSTVYMIMDYIEGEPMHKVLEAYGALPQEAIIKWAIQLSEVLNYLHTRVPPVIYRDMKPSNIMLKPDNTIRLFDFGIAKEYKEGNDSDTVILGTPGYAAPEQYDENKQSDARTDIYSLGVTLFQLVTGEPPQNLCPIRQVNPNLSAALEYVINKCTQLKPNDRFQNCDELTFVLENLADFEPAYQRKRKRKINVFMSSVICTAVFASIGTLGLFMYQNEKANTYDAYVAENTEESLVNAIDIDESNPKAYEKLAKKLKSDNIDAESDTVRDVIKKGFSGTNLDSLKQADIDTYIYVNYVLGYAYFFKYDGSVNNGDETGKEYFEKVITTADDNDYGKIDEQDYNQAVIYYLFTFFQSKLKGYDESHSSGIDVSEEQAVSIAAKKIGVDNGISSSGNISNPYFYFWKTNEALLETISNDNIRDGDQIDILYRLSMVLNQNYNEFYKYTEKKDEDERVTGDMIKQMYESLYQSIGAFDGNEDENEQKTAALEALDSVKSNIESLYKVKLEVEE